MRTLARNLVWLLRLKRPARTQALRCLRASRV